MIKQLIEVSTTATILRTLIFTGGHFLIDILVISSVTGAPLETATLASVLGPVLNGIWFFIIDRVWSSLHAKDENQHTFART